MKYTLENAKQELKDIAKVIFWVPIIGLWLVFVGILWQILS